MLLLVLAVVGVTGYFRLSSEACALRDSLLSSTSDSWHKKIALNIGPLTTGLARTGLKFVKKLPPEAQAAASAVRSDEVGIYELAEERRHDNPAAVIARADKAMANRGWMRMAAVSDKQQLVAIYVPLKNMTSRSVKCCVLVLDRKELVVASVRANPEPLIALATDRLHDKAFDLAAR